MDIDINNLISKTVIDPYTLKRIVVNNKENNYISPLPAFFTTVINDIECIGKFSSHPEFGKTFATPVEQITSDFSNERGYEIMQKYDEGEYIIYNRKTGEKLFYTKVRVETNENDPFNKKYIFY